MKTVISWLGFNEDFIKDGGLRINNNGFTASIHKDIIEDNVFERHIILTTRDTSNSISKELEKRHKILLSYLKEFYPKHLVEICDSGIDKNDLQNFPIIESRLRSFIQGLDATHDLHIIAGTGPTAVGMAWSTLSIAMNNRFQVHVMQRPEYTPGGKLSTLVEVKPYVNKLLDDKLRESSFNTDLPQNLFTDEIVKQEYLKAEAISPAVDVNVLILGETGCGKDRMAEFIVEKSPLDKKKYKAINCASLPDELLYSELFGHVKGAFTGADKERIGLFEECNGGSLFLDEIGDISAFMQQSLLRTLENGEIKKAGDNEVKKNIRVRIIAATNNDLYENCKSGKFRWDLYYRLCTMEICLAPYRQRDIIHRKEAINYYLKQAERKWGREIDFSKEAIAVIESYSFPGNFREIYNTINGLFALGKNKLGVEDLPKRFFYKDVQIDESYQSALRAHCLKIYEKYGKNLALTCKALEYKNQTQLKTKFEEWGVAF